MHLTDQEIAAYRAPGNQPEEIQRWREHVDQCAECRARVGIALGNAKMLRRLIEDEPDEHELILFASAKLGKERAEEIAAHLEECGACARTVQEAREDLRRMARPRAATARLRPIWWVPLAAATILAAGSVLWFRQRPAAPATPLATIQDGPRVVTLSATGSIAGVAGLQNDERQWIAAALATGRLTAGAGLAAEKPGVLRSPQSEVSFQLLAPLDARVVSARPLFRWQRMAGASRYRVKVFTDNDEIVARGETRDDSWQPPQDLPREVRLAWQVTAVRGADLVTAPEPPAPRAVFELIPAADAARIARAQAETPPSHLLLAAWYAREGMIAQARQELEALKAGNAGSPLVERLEESLAAK